jgi:transposase
MPKLLRVELTPEQQDELRGRLRAHQVPWHTRLRLECVRWSDAGLSVPQIAERVECHQVTVREALHRFADGGFVALDDAPRPGRPPILTRADMDALEAMLDAAAAQGRTVTAGAAADWLTTERGVSVSAAWLTVLLRRDGFRPKRTRDWLRHLADPVLQQAARARLEDLQPCSWRRTRR